MARIALPIETKVREFDGKLWLAVTLASRGHTVALGSKSDIHANLDTIQPDIYIQKSAVYDPDRLERMNYLRDNGTVIAVLDEEGGVFFSDEYYLTQRLSEEILAGVDLFFAWGEGPADILRHRTEFPEEDVLVTGNPRFDLLNNPLRDIYSDEAEALRDRFGEYVLVNTKFGFGNNKNPEKMREGRERRNVDQNEGMIAYQKSLIEHFIDAIWELAESEFEPNIMIRPHPSEDMTLYEEEFDSRDDVLVRHSGDVRAWIRGARTVIHNGCTTGIESALLDVPVFAYRPITDEEYDPPLPNFVSTQVYTQANLIESIRNLSPDASHTLSEEQRKELKRYFHNLNVSSSALIADEIDAVDSTADGDFPERSEYSIGTFEQGVSKVPFASPVAKRYRVVRNNLLPNREVNQKLPYLYRSEVVNRIADFSPYVSTDSIQVDRIGGWRDAFWIYDTSS
jgi:surface carbohydrate biosynthesis protein